VWFVESKSDRLQPLLAMPRLTDIQVRGVELYLLPVHTRVPLKFGPETLTEVTCARARVLVTDQRGRKAEGWGETPLSVQWVWPSQTSFARRAELLTNFCVRVAEAMAAFQNPGHPIEMGVDFQSTVLPGLLETFNRENQQHVGPMPWL